MTKQGPSTGKGREKDRGAQGVGGEDGCPIYLPRGPRFRGLQGLVLVLQCQWLLRVPCHSTLLCAALWYRELCCLRLREDAVCSVLTDCV